MSDSCGCHDIDADAVGARRRMLWAVLLINAAMFVAEYGAGLWARSTALQADALDMLADALVYAVSLWVVAGGARARAGAAMGSAALQAALGLGVLAQVAMQLRHGVTPVAPAIMGFAALALAANAACAVLLLRHRHADVNMHAVWVCTRNDMLGNLGALVAGALVALTGSRWPDVIVGAALALWLLRSAFGVARRASAEWRAG